MQGGWSLLIRVLGLLACCRAIQQNGNRSEGHAATKRQINTWNYGSPIPSGYYSMPEYGRPGYGRPGYGRPVIGPDGRPIGPDGRPTNQMMNPNQMMNQMMNPNQTNPNQPNQNQTSPNQNQTNPATNPNQTDPVTGEVINAEVINIDEDGNPITNMMRRGAEPIIMVVGTIIGREQCRDRLFCKVAGIFPDFRMRSVFIMLLEQLILPANALEMLTGFNAKVVLNDDCDRFFCFTKEW